MLTNEQKNEILNDPRVKRLRKNYCLGAVNESVVRMRGTDYALRYLDEKGIWSGPRQYEAVAVIEDFVKSGIPE